MSENFENDNNSNSVDVIHNVIIQSPTHQQPSPHYFIFIDPVPHHLHHHESVLNNSDTNLSPETDEKNDATNILDKIEMQAAVHRPIVNIDPDLTIRFDKNSMTYGQFIQIEHSYAKPIHDHLEDSYSTIEKLKNDIQKDKNHKSEKAEREFSQNNTLNIGDDLLADNSLKMMANNKSRNYLDLIPKEEMDGYESNEDVDSSNLNYDPLKNEPDQKELAGRSKRIRKKPKRWDNDEVVDFSGPWNKEDDKVNKDSKENEITSKKRKSLSQENTKAISVNNLSKKESISSDENEKKEIKNDPEGDDENYDDENEDDEDEDEDDEDEDDEDEDDEDDEEKKDVDKKDGGKEDGGKEDGGKVKEENGNADESNNDDDDDDPGKLWCICRKPYDERFMIQCDCCETWLHGKCVNLTKVQGRKIEKTKQNWYCPFCVEGKANGFTVEELKEQAVVRTKEIDEKIAEKRRQKENRGRKSNRKPRPVKKSANTPKKDDVKKVVETNNNDNNKKKTRSSLSLKEQPRAQASKTDDSVWKLRKLISITKVGLEVKIKSHEHQTTTASVLHSGHQSNVEQSMEIDKETPPPPTFDNDISNSSSPFNINSHTIQTSTISKPNKKSNKNKQCSNYDANSLSSKKKHKSDPVDRSAQDLFKAEPVLVRSSSSSSSSSASSLSVTTPTLSGNQQHKQKQLESSVGIESRRTSSSSSSGSNTQDITCPNGCGKVMARIGGDHTTLNNINSVYCNSDCIQNYVVDMIRNLHSLRRWNEKNDPNWKEQPFKIILIDRVYNLRRDDIDEKDVLDFIRANPTYEIRQPKKLRELGFVRTQHTSSGHKASNQKQSQDKHHSQHNRKSDENRKSSTTVASPGKIERSPSVSDGSDDNRRKFVRNAINEILTSRYNQMDVDEKNIIQLTEIGKLANKIEDELYKIFKNTNVKYNNKSRSLIFNLKDLKNNLYRKVLLGKITPERLVNMSAEELASLELARWREHEKKQSIHLYTNSAVDQANQVIVKKTHKGEELIENNVVVALTELPMPGEDSASMAMDAFKDDGDSLSMETDSIQDSISMAIGTVTSSLESIIDPVAMDVIDTTAQHIKHVFSKNCKICAKVKEERKSLEHDNGNGSSCSAGGKSFSMIGSSHTFTSPTKAAKDKETPDSPQRSQPKRIRVEPEWTNKFLEKAAQFDRLMMEKQQSTLADEDSLVAASRKETMENDSTKEEVGGSKNPERKCSESNDDDRKSSVHLPLNAKPIWRGKIFLQDMTKFNVNAYKIFGETTHILSKVPEKIVVCGRIAKEQVLNYVACVKKSQLGLVKFVWSRPEERAEYDSYFEYLHSRKRFGVIGSRRLCKDFYIMPLSKHNDIPNILLPDNQDESALGQKHQRPNLLLGILVKPSKNDHSISSSISISKTLPRFPLKRSYTPPLSSANAAISPVNDDRNDDDDDDNDDDDDDGSYTPPPPTVFAKKSTTPTKSKSSSRNDLSSISMSYAENKDLVASSVNPYLIGAIMHSDNPELRQKLNSSSIYTPAMSMSSSVAGPSSASFNHVFDRMHHIQIPDNLKDILRNVGTNPSPIEHQRMLATGIQPPFLSTVPSTVECDDNANIVAYNDPRLRAKINQSDLVGSVPQQPVAASMSQDELCRKAQEQIAALAQMEQKSAQEKAMLKDKQPIIVLGVPNDGHKNIGNSGRQNRNHHHYDDDDDGGGDEGDGVDVDIRRYHHHPRYAEHLAKSSPNHKVSFRWKKKK